MKDFPAAMAAAVCLMEYKLLGPTYVGHKPKLEGTKKHKAVGKPPNHDDGKKDDMASTPNVRKVTST